MRRPIIFAIVAGLMTLFALIFWQRGNAAGREPVEYGVSSNPYLPIQRLEPVY
jgi:hypothetical protein